MRHGDFFSKILVVAFGGRVPKVGKLTVFNIGGNKIRLVAAIHYNRRILYIRAVLTHREYDEGKWKE